MSKPTPGPWKVGREPLNPNPRIFGADKKLVVVVNRGVFFAEPTEANARLIASAPDLKAENIRLREVKKELLLALKIQCINALEMGYCLKESCHNCACQQAISKVKAT